MFNDMTSVVIFTSLVTIVWDALISATAVSVQELFLRRILWLDLPSESVRMNLAQSTQSQSGLVECLEQQWSNMQTMGNRYGTILKVISQ